MRVIFCLQYFSSVGGAEHQIIKLLPYLRGRGISCSVISQYDQAGRIFKKRHYALTYFVYVCRCAAAALLSCPRDVFYFVGSGWEKNLFSFIRRIKKIRYVVKFPASLSAPAKSAFDKLLAKPLSGPLLKQFYRRADRVIVQDEQTRAGLARDYPFRPEKVMIIRNGVAVHTQKRITAIHTILFAGRMIEEKGIYEIVEFARRAKGQYTIRLCGAGPELEAVKARTAPRECAGVEVCGFIPDMGPYYRSADLFLFPSRFREGLPNAVLEAMSFGVPVVSTRHPALEELFTENEHIFYLEPDELTGQGLAARAEALGGQIEKVNEVSCKAFQLVQQRFSLQQTCDRTIRMLKGVLNEG
ncbi:MAG: glycosyltransferase [Candidatus Omnitrophica bacterium]|nr:glycosyltransferase [Candidatus Omnitrophota bacterium]